MILLIRFLITRTIGLVFVLISVSFVTFLMGYFAPGDPIIALLGNHTTHQGYENLRHIYGLDLPWYQQYFNFLNNLLHGSFGYSFSQRDYSVLQATVILTAATVVIFNAMTDIAYAIVDPRIRVK